MANVYVDLDLVTGSNDGTTWANAYQSLVTAMNDTNAVGGDDVWIMGGTSEILVSQDAQIYAGITQPIRVWGVKSTTTNEPPIASDLIPGWRTGETRTEANLAYNDADIPVFGKVTGAWDTIIIGGYLYVYGVKFTSDDFFGYGNRNGEGNFIFEECLLEADYIAIGSTQNFGNPFYIKNCHIKQVTATDLFSASDTGIVEMVGGKITNDASAMLSLVSQPTYKLDLYGVDLSSAAHTLLNVDNNVGFANFRLMNCQLHASTAILSGTRASQTFRVELHNTANVTGKNSGTIQNVDIATEGGDITNETTAVRTGGADDGGTGLWAYAFTPVVNGTREQYYPLIGPWMAFRIVSGVSRTVTVYIANSGAADYNDDDVWLEVMYPSEGGTAQFDFQTTQMDLLATPTVVTDDIVSTWGTGGNNPQKLVTTVSPDYEGIAYCRVMFAKNFASSPETLYVDPQPMYA
jgi:hypothetical protein